jgi:hypothetical protein
MLIFDSPQPLWREIESAPDQAVCAVINQHQPLGHRWKLSTLFEWMSLPESDLKFITGAAQFDTEVIINAGTITGSRATWLALGAAMRDYGEHILAWLEGAFHHPFTEEYLLDVAISHTGFHELDARWNHQLYTQKAPTVEESKPGILHFMSQKHTTFWDMAEQLGI